MTKLISLWYKVFRLPNLFWLNHMDGIFLLLGSNLGDKSANLGTAIALMESFFEVTDESAIYESEPWGVVEQPAFFNKVIRGKSPLSAQALLREALAVEQQMGRERKIKWGERLIDIDILYYGNEVVNLPDLTIPHPEIPNRRFTLVPLCELAPGLMHPTFKKTQAQLLSICPDVLNVKIIR